MKTTDATQDHPARVSGTTLLELRIDHDAITMLPAHCAGALAKQE